MLCVVKILLCHSGRSRSLVVTVFELLDVEEYSDFYVRDHSRSLEWHHLKAWVRTVMGTSCKKVVKLNYFFQLIILVKL